MGCWNPPPEGLTKIGWQNIRSSISSCICRDGKTRKLTIKVTEVADRPIPIAETSYLRKGYNYDAVRDLQNQIGLESD